MRLATGYWRKGIFDSLIAHHNHTIGLDIRRSRRAERGVYYGIYPGIGDRLVVGSAGDLEIELA